jgi:hypothetical protein
MEVVIPLQTPACLAEDNHWPTRSSAPTRTKSFGVPGPYPKLAWARARAQECPQSSKDGIPIHGLFSGGGLVRAEGGLLRTRCAVFAQQQLSYPSAFDLKFAKTPLRGQGRFPVAARDRIPEVAHYAQFVGQEIRDLLPLCA